MQNIYKPTKDEKKFFHSDLVRFHVYAGKKIAELKRPPRSKTVARRRRQALHDEQVQEDDVEADESSSSSKLPGRIKHKISHESTDGTNGEDVSQRKLTAEKQLFSHNEILCAEIQEADDPPTENLVSPS